MDNSNEALTFEEEYDIKSTEDTQDNTPLEDTFLRLDEMPDWMKSDEEERELKDKFGDPALFGDHS